MSLQFDWLNACRDADVYNPECKIRNTARQHDKGTLTRQQVLSNFRSRGTSKLSVRVSPNVKTSWVTLTYSAIYVFNHHFPQEIHNWGEKPCANALAYNMIVGYAVPRWSVLQLVLLYKVNVHVSCVADKSFDFGQPSPTCVRIYHEFCLAYLIRQGFTLDRDKSSS